MRLTLQKNEKKVKNKMNLENFLLIALVFYLGWRLYEVIHKTEKNAGKIRLISKKTGQVIELNLLDEKGQPILKQLSPDEAFMLMAKDMFMRIVHAFTTGEVDKLKSMVSPKVLSTFANAIEKRRQDKQHMDFTLVDFKDVKILKTDSERIRQVAFTTEQINLLKDEQGKVISGDPMYVTTVHEVWTFEQQENKNWILTGTKQGAENVV